MFDNVGERIKSLAKILFVVNSVIPCILGLVLLFVGCAGLIPLGDTAGIMIGVFGGLLVAVLGVLFSYITMVFIYGFGELVCSSLAVSESIRNPQNDQPMEAQAQPVLYVQTDMQGNAGYSAEDIQKMIKLQEYVRNGLITQEEYSARMEDINREYASYGR